MKLIWVGKSKKIYQFRTNNHFMYYILTSTTILYIIILNYYTSKRFIEPSFDTIVPSVDILVRKNVESGSRNIYLIFPFFV